MLNAVVNNGFDIAKNYCPWFEEILLSLKGGFCPGGIMSWIRRRRHCDSDRVERGRNVQVTNDSRSSVGQLCTDILEQLEQHRYRGVASTEVVMKRAKVGRSQQMWPYSFANIKLSGVSFRPWSQDFSQFW